MEHTLGMKCLKLLKLSKADLPHYKANTHKCTQDKLINQFSTELEKSEANNILQGSIKRYDEDTYGEIHCSDNKEMFCLQIRS